MELKERWTTPLLSVPGFQSHLYGIERFTKEDLQGFYESFNRTFMELKGYADYQQGCSARFQSHLYGIESVQWGYNARHAYRFQSHLYGIESEESLVRFAYLAQFQSHLYGIERTYQTQE